MLYIPKRAYIEFQKMNSNKSFSYHLGYAPCNYQYNLAKLVIMIESENENMFTTELTCQSNIEYSYMILGLYINHILCMLFLYIEIEYIQQRHQ